AAFLDGPVEQGVDGAMAGQQEALQGRPAETLRAGVERPQAVVQRPALRRDQARVGQPVAVPDVTGIVRRRTDRLGAARRQQGFEDGIQGIASRLFSPGSGSASRPLPGTWFISRRTPSGSSNNTE